MRPIARLMKRLHINKFVVIYVFALAGLAFLGYYVDIYEMKSDAPVNSKTKEYFASDLTYYDLPRISMNLRNAESMSHVNIDISLEVPKKDMYRLEDFRSRITDRIVSYLYQQEVEKMRPPNNIEWLHHGILQVVNTTNQPVLVHDIVFRTLLIM